MLGKVVGKPLSVVFAAEYDVYGLAKRAINQLCTELSLLQIAGIVIRHYQPKPAGLRGVEHHALMLRPAVIEPLLAQGTGAAGKLRP